jgi:hypothetical protein
LINAHEAFKEKTKSAYDVQAFLKQLGTDYPGMQLFKAYTTWFSNNTNAIRDGDTLTPAEVTWHSFTNYCKQIFNLTPADLTAFSNGQLSVIERATIKELFKKAAKMNRKNTLRYIKFFALEYPTTTLGLAYNKYMGKYATDTNAVAIAKDTNFNYKAWLENVADPNGPIKLTREEALKYFNDFKAEAVNNK